MTRGEVVTGAKQLAAALKGLIRNEPLEGEDPETGEVVEVFHISRRKRWQITRPLWLYRLGAKELPCGCGRRLGRMAWYSGDCAKHSAMGAYLAARKDFIESADWEDVYAIVERLTAKLPADAVTVRGDRGFFGYLEMACTYGTNVRVYESSSAARPAVWLALDDNVWARHDDGDTGEAHAHLNEAQAARVVRALVTWLAQVEEAKEDTGDDGD